MWFLEPTYGILCISPETEGKAFWILSSNETYHVLNKIKNWFQAFLILQELVSKFNFHNYDSLQFLQKKQDPRRKAYDFTTRDVISVLYSAFHNDVTALRRWVLVSSWNSYAPNLSIDRPWHTIHHNSYLLVTARWNVTMVIDILASWTEA